MQMQVILVSVTTNLATTAVILPWSLLIVLIILQLLLRNTLAIFLYTSKQWFNSHNNWVKSLEVTLLGTSASRIT